MSLNQKPSTVNRELVTSGFTLIELIIVIAVLGILAVVIMSVLNPLGQIRKANDAGRKASLKQIQNSLEQYYNDTGAYPATSCWSGAACWTLGSGSFLGTSAATYLPNLPQDPSVSGVNCTGATSKGFYYFTPDSGISYKLITAMQNTSDPSVMAGAATYYNPATDGGGCNAVFNFKLVSQQQ